MASSLKALRRGDRVDAIYLVETANFKQARNGKPFLQMVLRDASAAVKGLRWETSKEEFREIERCPFLAVKGRVEEFQGNLQIVIDQLEPVAAKDARVRPEDFLPRSKHDVGVMFEALEQIVRSIPEAGVRNLVEAILRRPEVAEGIRVAPAGKSMHHAYVGGLLEHMLSLARLALKILDHYPHLDRSVLLAGVVLHDLGKVKELSYTTGFGYTDEGQLLGHIVIVLGWIDEAARGVEKLDAETLLELKHVVTSHHGKLEFGSPKIPMTAEAVALHFIDNLDAKLSALEQLYEDVAPTEIDRWSEFNHMLSTRVYFPRRLDNRSARGEPDPPPHAAPPQGELTFGTE